MAKATTHALLARMKKTKARDWIVNDDFQLRTSMRNFHQFFSQFGNMHENHRIERARARINNKSEAANLHGQNGLP